MTPAMDGPKTRNPVPLVYQGNQLIKTANATKTMNVCCFSKAGIEDFILILCSFVICFGKKNNGLLVNNALGQNSDDAAAQR